MCDPAKWVNDTANSIGGAIDNIISNPLPVIETVALTMVGVPLPMASAAVAAVNGGNIGDIAKSYVGGEVGGTVGQAAGTAAASAGANTLGASVAGSTAAGAASGGTRAALSGGDILKGAEKGATSGATGAGLTGGIKSGLDVVNPPDSGTPSEPIPYSPSDKTPVSGGLATADLGTPQSYLGPDTGKVSGLPSEYPVSGQIPGMTLQEMQDASATVQTPMGPDAQDTSKNSNKEIAKLISQGLRMQSSPSKSTTIGEPTVGSPMAYGASDVIGTQGTPGEIESKGQKKTQEYPWGEPKRTSALKKGLGI
jgi:hypothetical protein